MGFMEQKTKDMAHLHDLANVLDGNYRTTMKAEAELFELQKHFFYVVFLCKVTAAESVNIVKKRRMRFATKRLYTTLNGRRKQLWMCRLSVRNSVD